MLLTVAVGLALAGPAAPSHAAPTQASECSGVTVVVEFNRLGGGDQVRCAPGDPSSGVAALRGAGFEPTRAAQEAGYFVCRIDGKPADDPCQRASPEDAYWSYWHAEPGGSWTFSNTGAADYDPEPGTVEGWSFGAGEPPSTPPPAPAPQRPRQSAAPAPAPARTTAAPAPQPARTTAAPAPQAEGSSAPAAVTPAPSARPSASTARPSAPPPSAAPTPSGSEPAPLSVDDPVGQEDASSPLLGVLLAVAVVAGLGAAAAWQAQRRR